MTKKVYFRDVPQFTRHATYKVDVSWRHLEHYIEVSTSEGLDLEPDFQRAHVWSTTQRVRYVEYVLRGGVSGKDLFFNCPNWNKTGTQGPYVIVDGKQRLHAVRSFLAGDIPAFGRYRRDYADEPDFLVARFHWWVNDLDTREEVLQWYLDLNSGGTPHTNEELVRVQKLLKAERRRK